MGFVSKIFGGSSKAPKPPDPYQTAAAQSGMNREAIREAALHNQINQRGPLGSSTWSGQIGSPGRTQTTTLSPQQQALLLQSQKIQGGVGGLIQSLLPQVKQSLKPGAWEGRGLRGPEMQADIGPEMATSAAVAPGNMQDMITAEQQPPLTDEMMMQDQQTGQQSPSPLVQQLAQLTPEQLEAIKQQLGLLDSNA